MTESPNEPGVATHAFGIAIEADFEIPGLRSSPVPPGLPRTRVRMRSADDLETAWDPAEPTRLLEERFGDRKAADRTIDHDPALGYRLYARHFGLARISPDGRTVECAPPDVSAWRWQRFLVGRVLPWASLLSGRELIHASAVEVNGRAIAMVAASGIGKSSLALRMSLAGARFFGDDALAIAGGDAGVIAYPGPGIAAVRPAEKEALGRGGMRKLGRVLGTSGKTYVAIERSEWPRPLGAVYFLARSEEGGSLIEPGASARQLLGSAFISSVTSPQRLTRLLDICAELDRSTPLFQLGVDTRTGAEALAATVLDHARETMRETS